MKINNLYLFNNLIYCDTVCMENKIEDISNRLTSEMPQLGQSFVAVPQIVKQKLQIGYQIHDKNIDDMTKEFEALNERVELIISQLENFSNNILKLILSFTDMSRHFGILLKKNPISTLDSHQDQIINSPYHKYPNNSGTYATDTDFLDFKLLIDCLNGIFEKIESDLKNLNNSLINPWKRLLTICVQIKRTLSVREMFASSVMKYSEKVEKSNPDFSKKLTLKQEQNRMKYKHELRKYKEKYESINSISKIELQLFFNLFQKFLNNWVLIYHYLMYSIYYKIYIFFINCSEVKRILQKDYSIKKLSHDTSLSMSNSILDKYYESIGLVREQVEDLQIINFKKLYKDSVLFANKDASEQFKFNTLKGIVPTMYATALYGFVADKHDEDVISFKKGDVIQVIKQTNGGWWYGEVLRTRKRGLFPTNYMAFDRYM